MNLDKLIAAAGILPARDTLPAQPQLDAFFRALRHLDLDRPVDRLCANASTIQRLAEGHPQHAQNIIPLALEAGMWSDCDLDIGIAGLAIRTWQSLPPKPKHLPITDPGRNGEIESLAVRH